jgi:hypothetical protein
MKRFLALAALALASGAASATNITGNIALAGADTYTTSGIHFDGPGIVLIGTGNFATLIGDTFPVFPPSHQLVFAHGSGRVAFDIGGISMDLLTLNVMSENANFLNIIGTANMIEPGFTTTLYDYTLTATRPDGVSSYTMTAAPPAPVAEIGTLLMVGTAFFVFAIGGLVRRRSLVHG